MREGKSVEDYTILVVDNGVVTEVKISDYNQRAGVSRINDIAQIYDHFRKCAGDISKCAKEKKSKPALLDPSSYTWMIDEGNKNSAAAIKPATFGFESDSEEMNFARAYAWTHQALHVKALRDGGDYKTSFQEPFTIFQTHVSNLLAADMASKMQFDAAEYDKGIRGILDAALDGAHDYQSNYEEQKKQVSELSQAVIAKLDEFSNKLHVRDANGKLTGELRVGGKNIEASQLYNNGEAFAKDLRDALQDSLPGDPGKKKAILESIEKVFTQKKVLTPLKQTQVMLQIQEANVADSDQYLEKSRHGELVGVQKGAVEITADFTAANKPLYQCFFNLVSIFGEIKKKKTEDLPTALKKELKLVAANHDKTGEAVFLLVNEFQRAALCRDRMIREAYENALKGRSNTSWVAFQQENKEYSVEDAKALDALGIKPGENPKNRYYVATTGQGKSEYMKHNATLGKDIIIVEWPVDQVQRDRIKRQLAEIKAIREEDPSKIPELHVYYDDLSSLGEGYLYDKHYAALLKDIKDTGIPVISSMFSATSDPKHVAGAKAVFKMDDRNLKAVETAMKKQQRKGSTPDISGSTIIDKIATITQNYTDEKVIPGRNYTILDFYELDRRSLEIAYDEILIKREYSSTDKHPGKGINFIYIDEKIKQEKFVERYRQYINHGFIEEISKGSFKSDSELRSWLQGHNAIKELGLAINDDMVANLFAAIKKIQEPKIDPTVKTSKQEEIYKILYNELPGMAYAYIWDERAQRHVKETDFAKIKNIASHEGTHTVYLTDLGNNSGRNFPNNHLIGKARVVTLGDEYGSSKERDQQTLGRNRRKEDVDLQYVFASERASQTFERNA